MRTILPIGLLSLLSLAACGGGSDNAPARMGVAPDGGSCELPKDGTKDPGPGGLTYGIICPPEQHPRSCDQFYGVICCCPP